MEETEGKYKSELKDKTLLFEQQTNQLTEKHKHQLENEMSKYTELKNSHDH